MLRSERLKKNPKLCIFLPLYYSLWADSELSSTEVKEMRQLIDKQSWLTEEEKNWLQSHLNPSKPPKPKELKSWKAIIQKLEPEGLTDLFEIGKSLTE